MGFLDRWRLGAAALQVASAVRAVLAKIDGRAALEVALKIITLELGSRKPGEEKWHELADWFEDVYPQHAPWIDLIRLLVDASVTLFKAVGLFRSRAERLPTAAG